MTVDALVVAGHEPDATTALVGRRPMNLNVRETLRTTASQIVAVSDDVAMARVELFDTTTAPLLAESYFAGGDPGPIVAALATVPELLAPTLGFVAAALGDGAASTRHKEFAILRTSVLQGCRYCIHAHTAIALDVGLSVEEVHALRAEAPLEAGFHDDGERALICWIDAMAGATGPVPDDVWTAVRVHWPEHLLVELAVTIGATMFLNRFATGFELPASADVAARVESAALT